MGEKHALMAGATGLVGGYLLAQLLEDSRYGRVTVLGRRPLGFTHTRLTQVVTDFSTLPTVPNVDDVFSCLGTTLKSAGSKAAFRVVDFDHVLAVARLGLAGGARQFLHVTALGASARSPVYYNRVKAEIEAAVAALPYGCVHHLRPSMLDGPRPTSRPAEAAALGLMRLLAPVLGNLAPIHAQKVAKAMLDAAHQDAVGVFTHESGRMLKGLPPALGAH